MSPSAELGAVVEIMRVQRRMSREDIVGMLALALLTEAEADAVIAEGLALGFLIEVDGELQHGPNAPPPWRP